ncbi:MAG: methyltransferase domain-containing protein [Shimia sp.]
MTDRTRLKQQRARAERLGPENFLLTIAADELHHRIGMVNRSFTSPAVVSAFPRWWAQNLDLLGIKDATCVEDTETLDLQPGAHDLVLHVMTLHWASDPVGQLIQCRRALKPDGLCLAVTLGGATGQELRAALATAEAEMTGGLSPRVLPMGDVRDLGGLMARAGFQMPVADTLTLPARYRSLPHIARDLRRMGESNAMAQRRTGPMPRKVARRTEELLDGTRDADGIPLTFELVTLTGWSPGPNQPTPKRPGSATTRLADALGVPEHPAPRLTDGPTRLDEG